MHASMVSILTGLSGKPASDMFQEAARRLGVSRSVCDRRHHRARRLGLVVSVGRGMSSGAAQVVADLSKVDPAWIAVGGTRKAAQIEITQSPCTFGKPAQVPAAVIDLTQNEFSQCLAP
jgi:hypothetical protein